MPLGIDEVRNDAAALHRFIDSIVAECSQCGDQLRFLKPTELLLRYIQDLAASTKAHLAGFVGNLDPSLAIRDPDDFCSQAQRIQTLRLAWFDLHERVKPALDADTLHIPYPLIKALTSRLQAVAGFQNVEFAVLHCTEVNYFQIRAGHVRERANEIRKIIPNAPEFPSDLGIIALPYSQATAFFSNAALAHEMGHFVYQERCISTRFRPLALNALSAAKAGNLAHQELSWCLDCVLRWCEEIYCDLFAIYLVGPAFSFSFIELFALTRLAPYQAASGGSLPSIASKRNFRPTHPAEAFRLAEHLRFLQSPELGWWDGIKDSPSHYLRLLIDADGLPQSWFTFPNQSAHAATALAAFLRIAAEVSQTVLDTFKAVSTEAQAFHSQKVAICEYLSHGVVPSRLTSDDSAARTPSPVAVINSAYLFCLDELDDLISRIEGADLTCLQCRAFWTSRVELWTWKALEDLDS